MDSGSAYSILPHQSWCESLETTDAYFLKLAHFHKTCFADFGVRFWLLLLLVLFLLLVQVLLLLLLVLLLLLLSVLHLVLILFLLFLLLLYYSSYETGSTPLDKDFQTLFLTKIFISGRSSST